jgi:Ca2+-binding EF-hand superfamily protein
MVFTIVAELVGLAFFALLIQTINTLKEVIGLKEQEQRDTKNKLVDQMKRNDLSDDLIAKVVKFLNFKNTSKAGRAFLKEDPDFNELSHALQRQVSRETNLPYVKNVKILGHSMDDQLEMDNVKDIFEEANEGDDPNPALDRGEINNLVLKLGVSSDYFTKERLDEAMNSMDSSGDGEVELDEFQNWWYTQLFKRPRMKPCPKGLLDEIAECLECVPASPGDIIVPKLKYGESFFVLQACVRSEGQVPHY